MSFNYENLLKLTKDVPEGLDYKKKKEPVSKELRIEIYARDKGICYLCGDEGGYGANISYMSHISGRHNLHHIIPNGEAKLNNIVTLCQHCHTIVHLILYKEGKWRYVRL